MLTATRVGRTDVGASWFGMNSGPIYMQSVSMPSGLLLSVAAHIRHSVANVPHAAAYVFSDDDGEPDLMLARTAQAETALLFTSTGRWFHFPVGRWFESPETVWIGITMTAGGSCWEIAYDSTGGDGGSFAGPSDTSAWTSGTNSYSIHAVVVQ